MARVILLDCPLEYKKGENSINVELKDANNFEQLLKLEEEYVKGLCEDIAGGRPSQGEEGVVGTAPIIPIRLNLSTTQTQSRYPGFNMSEERLETAVLNGGYGGGRRFLVLKGRNGCPAVKFKPDVVFTEKGLSDIAAHYLMAEHPSEDTCLGGCRAIGTQWVLSREVRGVCVPPLPQDRQQPVRNWTTAHSGGEVSFVSKEGGSLHQKRGLFLLPCPILFFSRGFPPVKEQHWRSGGCAI